MATVPSLSSPPCLLHSQVAAHRDRQRCRSDLFIQPGQQQQVPQLSRKAKLHCAASSRCACACAQAGTHGGGRRAAAGVHPAGHRSLLVVVVALIAAAARSKRAGEKSEERSFRCQHVRTYSTQYAYRQAAGPRSESCLPVDRSDSIAALVHAVDRRTWTDRQPGLGQRPPSVTRHHQLIEYPRASGTNCCVVPLLPLKFPTPSPADRRCAQEHS